MTKYLPQRADDSKVIMIERPQFVYGGPFTKRLSVLGSQADTRYCKCCAWLALTSDKRTYCESVHEDFHNNGANVLHWFCTRAPGHDGPHVACGSVHSMFVWEGTT